MREPSLLANDHSPTSWISTGFNRECQYHADTLATTARIAPAKHVTARVRLLRVALKSSVMPSF